MNNVIKTYPDGFQAVKGVQLDIADGEFIVLVGPSGCGKSTTLRMVAGLEDISGGTISIDDRVVNEVHPKDRDIAMVFQNYALYPHMSVRENIAFALRLRKMPIAEIDRRVNAASAMLGLDTLLDRKPRALSGGQRQRVAVGRAIVREPKVFLFDEPLSNLDARLRNTMRSEIKALQQRLRTTTIYVTHDQEEAMTLGDRIVVMFGGVIQQAGPPLAVYRRPVNRFVASFVGAPAMNCLDGRIEREGGALLFVERGSGGLRITLPNGAADRLAAHIGREVVLGIRPQQISEGRPDDAASVTLPISLTEPLGDSIDVMCTTAAGASLVARLPARDGLKAGASVTLILGTPHLCVFEPGELGRNLLI